MDTYAHDGFYFDNLFDKKIRVNPESFCWDDNNKTINRKI